MGATRSCRRHPDGGWPLTDTTVRVVPNVPSFSVDRGFWYLVPETLSQTLETGSIVRVPLSGRRVRGGVVETSGPRQGKLKEVAGVSAEMPVFDAELLAGLMWAADHYVAPLSVLLAKASPPNLPRRRPGTAFAHVDVGAQTHPLADVARSAADNRKRPAGVLLAPWQRLEWIPSLGAVLAAGASALVIAGTSAEVESIASRARECFGERVIGVSGESDAETTSAWEAAQNAGVLLVGTPRTAAWRVEAMGLALVLEEGRRAMKDRQTPTVHVRDLIRTRSMMEGFTSMFFGATPSVEVLSGGAEIVRVGNRAWPLVEVVDRSEEAPGSGLVSSRVVAALRATVSSGARAFLFTSRRMAGDVAAETNVKLGRKAAQLAPTNAPIVVGTERDLAGLAPMALTVSLNTDGMLLSSGYRTSEEALRALARLANALAPGSGHRMMVQSFEPGSSLVETLRRGDPIPYLEDVLVDRARLGMPPAAEVIAVEIRGEQPEDVTEVLGRLPGTNVLGPLEIDEGRRWLLQGSLGQARIRLRDLVGGWRAENTHVRVDADPIDL